jgi:hypothetical protein
MKEKEDMCGVKYISYKTLPMNTTKKEIIPAGDTIDDANNL